MHCICACLQCDDVSCKEPGKIELPAIVADVCGSCTRADLSISVPLFRNLTGREPGSNPSIVVRVAGAGIHCLPSTAAPDLQARRRHGLAPPLAPSGGTSRSFALTPTAALLPRPPCLPADVVGRDQLRTVHRGQHQNAIKARRQASLAWGCVIGSANWPCRGQRHNGGPPPAALPCAAAPTTRPLASATLCSPSPLSRWFPALRRGGRFPDALSRASHSRTRASPGLRRSTGRGCRVGAPAGGSGTPVSRRASHWSCGCAHDRAAAACLAPAEPALWCASALLLAEPASLSDVPAPSPMPPLHPPQASPSTPRPSWTSRCRAATARCCALGCPPCAARTWPSSSNLKAS